jgi:hypothetical protein
MNFEDRILKMHLQFVYWCADELITHEEHNALENLLDGFPVEKPDE